MTAQLLENVIQRVRQDDIGKVDFNVNSQDLLVTNNGRLHFYAPNDEMQVLNFNDHALGQMSTRLGIPTRYARKCMENEPRLYASHANHWLNQEEQRDKGLFLRTRGDELRAVLSDRYATLDNHYVTEILEQVLGGYAQVDVKGFNLDPRYFNLRLVFSDMNVNLGTSMKKDDVMVGLQITNSEVGSSSLRVDSCLFRLVCTNGLISRIGGQPLLAQRHSNVSDTEMQNRVGKSIVEAVSLGDIAIDKFAKLKEVKVSNAISEIKELAKKQKYSERATDILVDSYSIEKLITGEESAYEVVNAFTRMAQQTQTYDRRLEIETFAGSLMDSYLK